MSYDHIPGLVAAGWVDILPPKPKTYYCTCGRELVKTTQQILKKFKIMSKSRSIRLCPACGTFFIPQPKK